MRGTRIIDGIVLLVIPALIYGGLLTEDSWDYGYSYPEGMGTANILGPLGADILGWLRFNTGELVFYVPAAIVAVYLLAIKLPFSLFFRTATLTALALAGYHTVTAETVFAAEQMGNLPFWLKREFPTVLPLLVPITVLTALIGCGRLILRLVDPPEREA